MHDRQQSRHLKHNRISGYCVGEIELCAFSRLIRGTPETKTLTEKVRGVLCMFLCVLCEGDLGDLQGTGVGVSIYSVTAH